MDYLAILVPVGFFLLVVVVLTIAAIFKQCRRDSSPGWLGADSSPLPPDSTSPGAQQDGAHHSHSHHGAGHGGHGDHGFFGGHGDAGHGGFGGHGGDGGGGGHGGGHH